MNKKQRNTSLLILLFVLLIWYSRKNKSKAKETQNKDRRYGWSCTKVYQYSNDGSSLPQTTQCNPCIYNPLTRELTPNPRVADDIIDAYNDGQFAGYYIGEECRPLRKCEFECGIAYQSVNEDAYNLPY